MKKTKALGCKAVGRICDLPPERFGHNPARCFQDDLALRREDPLLMKVLVFPIHRSSEGSITMFQPAEAGGSFSACGAGGSIGPGASAPGPRHQNKLSPRSGRQHMERDTASDCIPSPAGRGLG